jgi:sulfhydrogenase subunit alpha
LRGRDHAEAPDITARICGICPIAYMMGASQAMEDALDVRVEPAHRDLRRLIYCGEWIESHVLHAAMLHAPDFLGLDDALSIARDNPELVKTALQLKKLGNDILETVGGRAVHPVNLKIGGFYKAPDPAALEALLPRIDWALEAARTVALAFSAFDFPDLEQDYHCVSLRHPDEYAIHEGRIVSNRGVDIALDAFLDHFGEEHVAHSNALHGLYKDGDAPYLVGPLARYTNNHAQLSDDAKTLAEDCGLGPAVANPYKSILVRMVETFYALEEAKRLIEGYAPPVRAAVDVAVKAGTGYGCTEAPRGICFHTYDIDADGLIERATIIPPTSQNQKQIEADLLAVVSANLDMENEALKWRCEQTIRNYDPCISCATHFLDLTIDRD